MYKSNCIMYTVLDYVGDNYICFLCTDATLMISQREDAIKEARRPLRKCRTCCAMCHHDLRSMSKKTYGDGQGEAQGEKKS